MTWLKCLARAGVRIPSVNPARSGGNGEGDFQQFIAGQLKDLGADVDMWEPKWPRPDSAAW